MTKEFINWIICLWVLLISSLRATKSWQCYCFLFTPSLSLAPKPYSSEGIKSKILYFKLPEVGFVPVLRLGSYPTGVSPDQNGDTRRAMPQDAVPQSLCSGQFHCNVCKLSQTAPGRYHAISISYYCTAPCVQSFRPCFLNWLWYLQPRLLELQIF